MEEIHELLGYEGLKIYQRKDAFSFSLDSMLLADFIKIRQVTKKIIELGCGNAPILLFLTMKTKAQLFGIEIQKEIYDLALKSVKINNLESQITLINDDLKQIYKKVGANSYDIVISNPPFFKYQADSYLNKNDLLTIARHEVKTTLEDIIIEARKLLVDGGSIFMIHRCERLSEVISTFNQYNFGVRTIKFIYSKATNEHALMFLIEARLNKKDDVKVLKPFIVYDENNEYTYEVKEIFNFNEKNTYNEDVR